jgi:hypothetical protein
VRTALSPVTFPAPASWSRAGIAVAATPRTSERALLAIGALSFQAFLVAQFLSLTRLFWSTHIGEGASTLASLAGLLSVALLAPAVLAYGLRAGSLFGTLVPAARAWVVAVSGLSTFLFFYGWLAKGYELSAAVHDLAPYLVLLASAVLGSMPRVWQDTDWLIVALFSVALVMNAGGMTEMTQVVSESYAEDRAGPGIVAYRTQAALAFWPLLFLTARLRSPRIALLSFAGVFFVLAQQILFQKRAPSFRIALFVLVFLFVLPRLRPQPATTGRSEGRVRAWFLGTGALALFLAVALAPWLFYGQISGLAERISGQRYTGGATGMLIWENERFAEANMYLRTVQPEELVFGRGFGGYYLADEPGWGVWLDDVQEFGRRQLHVGALMPMLKGGLALTLAYYAGLFTALLRGARSLAEPFATAVFFVVLIQALFLLQEGFFIMSVSFDLVMVGLCMGHLLSSRREPALRAAPAFRGRR